MRDRYLNLICNYLSNNNKIHVFNIDSDLYNHSIIVFKRNKYLLSRDRRFENSYERVFAAEYIFISNKSQLLHFFE